MFNPSVDGTAEGVPTIRSYDLLQDLRTAIRTADFLMRAAEPTRHGNNLLVNAELHESLGYLLRQAGELAGRLDARA